MGIKRLVLLLVLAAPTVGCARTSEPTSGATLAPEAPVAAEDAQLKLRPPRVVPAMPLELHVDLGPILISSISAPMADPTEFLAIEADRLRADGFVFERRGYHDVYLIRDVSFESGPLLTLAAIGLFIAFQGRVDLRLDASTTGFYRAFRLVDSPPPPLESSSFSISPELRARFAAAADLNEQFLLAHALLGTGALSRHDYATLRSHLVAPSSSAPH